MQKSSEIKFKNSYAKELHEICERCFPVGYKGSEILLKNYSLAEELGLNKNFVNSEECLELFSGLSLSKSSLPIAQGYSGHQFGYFNPQLGDGRAILLGEITNKDIQLKGIGKTPYSRRGDGKSSLGPVLREYIVSEFMHRAKIPTTRSLFAIKTNENVVRETEQPGGILARVAKSHIRIGTFEYAKTKNNEVLKSLADYSISRHFPDLNETDNKYLSFFAAVCNKQAMLIAKWMSLGFVHGVMNTDNMTISGETIDYGPCAFMDRYDPKSVFSSIDHNGRYAYENQPIILVWNLSKFAETLIPLINENPGKSLNQLNEVLQLVTPTYQEYFYKEFSKKLGLTKLNNTAINVIEEYLKILESHSIDFTQSFRDLSKMIKKTEVKKTVFSDVPNFNNWYLKWQNQLCQKSDIRMDDINPCYIPRNHMIEDALIDAMNGSYLKINKILNVLENPFVESPNFEEYGLPAFNINQNYVTYCGT